MNPIDEYLATVEPAKRKALERIRTLAKKAIPEAEETITYGMPTLKYQGKPVLGFDAHKNHIGLYPYSSQVIETLRKELTPYATSKGAIQIPLNEAIPENTLQAIIASRLQAIRDAQKT